MAASRPRQREARHINDLHGDRLVGRDLDVGGDTLPLPFAGLTALGESQQLATSRRQQLQRSLPLPIAGARGSTGLGIAGGLILGR
jgi:hypothetical protein